MKCQVQSTPGQVHSRELYVLFLERDLRVLLRTEDTVGIVASAAGT